MPLRAVIDGRSVTGPDLSRKEWDDLARRHRGGLAITMPCCGMPGHLRRSRSGTQHFYHATDAGCRSAEESPEHLAIKERVWRACRSQGWEACTEFPAPDRSWISDVLAEKDGRKIAFEIQISALSPELLEERDRKYRGAGIESWWLIETGLLRSRHFSAWSGLPGAGVAGKPAREIPYTDAADFAAGPGIRIFLSRGVHTFGLDAEKQALVPDGRPAIPIEDGIARVLRQEEQGEREEIAAFLRRKLELKAMAAPALVRLRGFYESAIRHGRYRHRIDTLCRRVRKNGEVPEHIRGRVRRIVEETGWLENEYHAFMADAGGLFRWKKTPGTAKAVPVFRLASEIQVARLREFAEMLDRWDESFCRAIDALERETGELQRR